MEKIEPSDEFEIVKINNDREFKIGINLEEKEEINLLRENLDVFAWEESDLHGIKRKLIEHKLDLDPKTKPIKQK